MTVDPRLVAALREQLARRPREAARIGWKVGAGDRESIDGGIVVGHLTSTTQLADSSTYDAGEGDLHADVELAIRVGQEQAIDGYGVALELVDPAGTDDPDEIVAGNVFHRAVCFGPMQAELPARSTAKLLINGEVAAEAELVHDVSTRVRAVAEILHAVGERLQPDDRVITGSIVQEPVRAGDEVVAEIRPLGRVRLRVA